jgi:hypothetical protein
LKVLTVIITNKQKEPIMATTVKAFQKKRTQVLGIRYSSRTKAIQHMLTTTPMSKYAIAKYMHIRYNFVNNVAKKMMANVVGVVAVVNQVTKENVVVA